jgi:tetratricopeptide (TPR) repeat protein
MNAWASTLACCTCALVVFAPVAARAQAEPQRSRADLFERIGDPDARRAAALGAQAQAQLAQAERLLPADWETLCRTTLDLPHDGEALPALRAKGHALHELARDALRALAHVESAIERLERARKLAPSDPVLLFAHARALALWQSPGPGWACSAQRRDAEAIALLEELMRAHPSYAPERAAFELGILLTRALRFEEASAAYDRAAALALEDAEASTARGNQGETLMLAGKLEAAVASYERAIAQAQAGRGHALSVWGLAVALERSGEHARALERLQRAFGAAGEALSVLRAEGVFFSPSYEIHAYEALGHEARGAALEDRGERAAALREAASSYRTYLAACAAFARRGARALPEDYEHTAREGLARVLKALVALTPKAKRAKRAS